MSKDWTAKGPPLTHLRMISTGTKLQFPGLQPREVLKAEGKGDRGLSEEPRFEASRFCTEGNRDPLRVINQGGGIIVGNM